VDDYFWDRRTAEPLFAASFITSVVFPHPSLVTTSRFAVLLPRTLQLWVWTPIFPEFGMSFNFHPRVTYLFITVTSTELFCAGQVLTNLT
jgi:hypothetical protein